MNPMLNIAIRAARRAGNVIAKNYERRDDIQTSKKGINDYVTSVDKAAEAEIIEIIQKSYPDHTIISEERIAIETEKCGKPFTKLVVPSSGSITH